MLTFISTETNQIKDIYQKPIYLLYNYDNHGLLFDIYQQENEFGLEKLFQSDDFKKFMYYDGQGDIINRETESSSVSLMIYGSYSHNDLTKYRNRCIRNACWRIDNRGNYGESLLHILIINNNKISTKIAKQLLLIYPNLVFDVFESIEYFGVSALHLSIAYKNTELTQLLLDYGADVNQRAIGTFFIPDITSINKRFYKERKYFGEYPLTWAACVDDKQTYNSLVNYGADPNLKDTFGNTVLHVIVISEQLMIYGFALNHPIKPAKNDVINNFGLTPLSLACVLGKAKVFYEIVELSSKIYWSYSIITCCCYPLNVIDSMQLDTNKKELSALNIILEGNKNEHLEMLNGGLVHKLLEEKWKTFGHKQFIRKIYRAFLHLIILSIAVFLRPTKNSPPDCEDQIKKYIRMTTEILICLSCAKHIVHHFIEFFNSKSFNVKHFENLPRSIFLISNFLVLISFLCRLCNQTFIEELCLIFALPCSWFFLIFFAAAVRLTGPFVSMIRYMILQDMRQFSIIYLVFLYGFSQAFFFLLKSTNRKSSNAKLSNHLFYHQSWMELFKMTLGAHEYEELRSSYYQWLTQFFFVLFMILMPILLLNMLIAMMGNTYSLVISQSEKEWTKQWAKTLLELEKSLSKKEIKLFLSQYTINFEPTNKDSAALMVIKNMSISKAKQRKQAIANWKKLQWRVKMMTSNKDQQ